MGLLESMLTAKLVDDSTDTRSRKTREAWGQGPANMLSGLFGGMGGCAMIGRTMISARLSGARMRISTFLAGLFLLILVVVLGDLVGVPWPSWSGVGRHVSTGTASGSTLKRMPKSEAGVMIAPVAVVVATQNLAIGVQALRCPGRGR